MDIKLEKKPWYIRYKFYIAGGIAFVAFLVYVIILSAGPRKLRIESENIQIAEVKNGKLYGICRCGGSDSAHPYHQGQCT
mgnify:CR=1 FL=1